MHEPLMTHKYQGGVEVILVLLVEVSIIFVRLFAELLMETCTRIWLRFLLRESGFEGGSKGAVQPSEP